jgi:cytidylate kinase
MKIAIDGPAGAGKSTLARALAGKLGFLYIDTGAMYRALTWKALQQGIDVNDPVSIYSLASSFDIYFEKQADIQRLICDGEDITELIRSPQVSAEVSKVAAHPQVREIMVRKQQLMARTGNVVMDGRDIGEQVLPDARFKFFVTADLAERAQRRVLEMESKGYEVNKDSIIQDMRNRDQMDSEREIGALKILPDAIVIDTTLRSANEVLAQILSIIGEG